MHLTTIFTSLIATAAASPIANLAIRDPSDQSGNTKIVFHTQSATIPNTPGDSIANFQNDISLTDSSGAEIEPECSKPYTDKNLHVCVFKSDNLKEDVEVTAVWHAPGAPQISFTYQGHDYSSSKNEPECGHTTNSRPFGGDYDALCYFDA